MGDSRMVKVKCIVEMEFENDKPKVSYTDVHDLELVLSEQGIDFNRIVLAPADEVKIITFGK